MNVFSKILSHRMISSLLVISIFIISGSWVSPQPDLDKRVLSYAINPKKQNLAFYHKNSNGKVFRNHAALRSELEKEGKTLLFAMNGGMYLKDFSPQGLYIENGKLITPLNNRKSSYGNFYLEPNGIFYLQKDMEAAVIKTSAYSYKPSIEFATQSGPMLLIDGNIHPKFKEGSKNLHIRNGVGILPNGNLLFAMSKEFINFYDFATFFKSKGCKNALYLDGFVSRTYLPSKSWKQTDGNYAIIIAETQ